MVGNFLLSYITPDEFALLLDSITAREDSRKLRTVSHSIVCDRPSPETEHANRQITRHVEKDLRDKQFIGAGPSHRIIFGSFDNQQRILFFMKFTSIADVPGIRFDKLTDISLKLDESKPVPNQERLNWMRDKVRTLKLEGDALQETFFVTDMTCREFVIFWKVEANYLFDWFGESGRFTAVFEFHDYASREAADCEFQISITTLSIDGKQQTHPDCSHLKKQFALRLNQEKERAFSEAIASPSNKA